MKKTIENKKKEKDINLGRQEERKLQEIFSVDKQEDVKDVKITYDKKQEQLSVKIPKDFARELNINPEKNFLRFMLLISNQNKKILHIDLIQDEKEEKID